MLPFIIHENQGGFVKGRFIGENIKLIGDIIYICNINMIIYFTFPRF